MEFSSLSSKNKKDALEQSLFTIQQELYITLVRVNIDPDTFNVEEWEEPSPVVNNEHHRVTQLVNSLLFTQNKLAELS